MPSSSRRAGKLVVWMLRRGGGWGPGSLAGWVAGWQGASASTAGSSLVARTASRPNRTQRIARGSSTLAHRINGGCCCCTRKRYCSGALEGMRACYTKKERTSRQETRLMDQLTELLSEAVQHTRLRHPDGRRADTQTGGDLGWGMLLDGR